MIRFIKHHANSLHYFISDFIPFLKALLRNPVYMLFIVISVLQFSAFIGMISFMPKYLEQQFGKSASDAIFLIGKFASFCLTISLLKLSVHIYICIFMCVCTHIHTVGKCFCKWQIPHYKTFVNSHAFSAKNLLIFCQELNNPLPICWIVPERWSCRSFPTLWFYDSMILTFTIQNSLMESQSHRITEWLKLEGISWRRWTGHDPTWCFWPLFSGSSHWASMNSPLFSLLCYKEIRFLSLSTCLLGYVPFR